VTQSPQIFGKIAARNIFQQILANLDLRATLAAAMARSGSRIHCGDFSADLRNFSRIVAIAIGKAAAPMAEAFDAVLAPDFHADGILAAPVAPENSLPHWRIFVGGHPVPTEESFRAGRAILDCVARADDRMLIVFLLSGGGSALAEFPLHDGFTLRDVQLLNHVLVTCGAPIEEINIVRKHLSALKGGRLAAAAPLATKLTYAVSDVPPGYESALASGPTLPDPTSIEDCERVIRRHSLLHKLPASVRKLFDARAIEETPKPGDAAFNRAYFQLILGHHQLTHAAHHAAEALGYASVCVDDTDGWALEKAADHLLDVLARAHTGNPGKRVCVIANGEISSPVTGDGIGGRNSAFVLTCVEKIAGSSITVLSGGTDGVDGNSPAAGAVADGETLARARRAGLLPGDYLARSDAYNFFRRLDDAVETGPTGNNLRDLRVLLAE